MTQPRAERPDVPEYGIPATSEGTLSYDFVEDRLLSSRNYWISTVRPDCRPHSVPTWGVWLDGKLYFGGGTRTRKARNLAANPHVAAHTESADEVVILEGSARIVADADEQRRVDDAYEAKYGMRHGPTVWCMTPEVAFGWTTFPDTVTRWRLPPGDRST
jgi:nitroimidazol reductase NimA-like FMN-containing flavoprotein (pyridoxamine 5'-phosphate oxidase superfamily)